MIAVCSVCGRTYEGRPGDEHGPVVLLLEHWRTTHGIPQPRFRPVYDPDLVHLRSNRGGYPGGTKSVRRMARLRRKGKTA